MTGSIPLVDLKKLHEELLPALLPRIESIARRSDFILGEEVLRFEQSFADYCGSRWAVGVGNGTDALHLALRALDVGPGDEVVLPANTFIGTAFAVSHVGARPVLVDCIESSFLMDPRAAADRVTDRTRAIIPVHLFGRMVDIEPLAHIGDGKDLHILEDAAQSHGALIRGERAGSVGALGCFSFYPGKNLGAFGDGGAVVTSNERLRDRLLRLRNHGSVRKYEHSEIGYNSRLDTIQAVVLSLKLPDLDTRNRRRLSLVRRYQELLEGVGDLVGPEVPADGSHVCHLFVLRTSRRDALLSHLHERGVMAGVHYPKPVHLHEAYVDLGHTAGAFPVAERLSREIISLPLYPELAEEQQDRIVAEVRAFFDRFRSS